MKARTKKPSQKRRLSARLCAPFVLTIATGALAGCGPEPLPGNPPQPEVNPPPPEVMKNPPEPAKRNIFKDENGKCWEEIDVQCPPPESGATCNPPAPQPVDCPPEQ